MVVILSRTLEDAGFGLELLDELGNRLDLDASLAAGRLLGLQHLEARLGGDAEVSRALLVERLLLCLHDVRQRGVARLVEAQVGGDDCRELDVDRLQAAVDFAGHGCLAPRATTFNLDLRGEGRLCRAEQGCQHLAGLVRVVVDCLLADNHEARLFGVCDALEDLGDGEWLDGIVGLDENGAIRTHGERRAQRFFSLGRPDRHDHHFLGLAGFLQPQRLFHRDLVERVHRHLHIGELNTRAIRLHTDLHVVVDDALYCDENFHLRSLRFEWFGEMVSNGPAWQGWQTAVQRLLHGSSGAEISRCGASIQRDDRPVQIGASLRCNETRQFGNILGSRKSSQRDAFFVEAAIGRAVGKQLIQHRSLNETRADRVAPDTLRPVVQCHRLDQAHDAVLACAICGIARCSLCARVGCDRGEASFSAHETGHRTLGQQESTLEIDVHHEVKGRLIHFGDGSEPRNAGTMNDVVDAPEAVNLSKDISEPCAVGDIRLECVHGSAAAIRI
ncbi:hypothetical protein RHECNPAF_13300158 [Rhizobium etli CNPAF512]|nr:hypothetical protein RHECNPAF_13300158 [Rhizobium etli CNPAF512]